MPCDSDQHVSVRVECLNNDVSLYANVTGYFTVQMGTKYFWPKLQSFGPVLRGEASGGTNFSMTENACVNLGILWIRSLHRIVNSICFFVVDNPAMFIIMLYFIYTSLMF